MKLSTAFVFLLSTLIVDQEVFAQTRGPRYNPPGGGGNGPGEPIRAEAGRSQGEVPDVYHPVPSGCG